MTESALIVDDSRTARSILEKILADRGIDCALVESGEEALDYLEDAAPDVIFMDHMMPGMDGFEAVKAIKADQSRSQIPIVMYTTRAEEGHIYIGQAHALGAADILNKPPSVDDVEAVLERLAAVDSSPELEVVPVFEPEAEPGPPVDKSNETPPPIAEQPVQLGSAVNPYKWWSAIFLVISIMLLLLLIEAKLRQQRELDSYLNSLQWAINQDLSYDYDDIPLSGKRLIRLAGLIAQLERVGFKGKVVVEGHIGAFCLQELGFDLGQDDNSLILPESNSLLSDCHTLGLPFAEERSIAQSDAFRDFITGFNLLQGSAIRIELVAKGDDDPLYDYPASGDNLTAGDWNVVALRNNRVRLLIEPES